MVKKYKSGERWLIADRRAVANLLDEIIKTRFGGLRVEGAARFGINRATLLKLLRGEQKSIRRETLYSIVKNELTKEEVSRFVSAFLSPLTYELESIHFDWEQALVNRTPPGAKRGARTVMHREGWDETSARYEWPYLRERERERLEKHARTLFAKEFADFYRWAYKKKHAGVRLILAERRVLDPLLEHLQSGLLERSWEELTPAELKSFVRAGFTREKILLNREPLHARAAAKARQVEAEKKPSRRARSESGHHAGRATG